MSKQNINWWLNSYFYIAISLILGITTLRHPEIYLIFILICLFSLKKNKATNVFILAYITGLIVATREEKLTCLKKTLISRQAVIEGKILNIEKNNSYKIKNKIISINEPIDKKFIPTELYTSQNKAKVGDRFRSMIGFGQTEIDFFWQPFLNNFSSDKNHSLQEKHFEIKNNIEKNLEELTIKNLNTICWGESNTYSLTNIYRLESLGCQHLLARSGLHLSPIICIVNLSQNIFFIIISIFALIYYALISSCSPSFLRAIVIAIIFLINTLISFKNKKTAIFLQSIILILIFQPYLIYSISFQLSFALTAGLYFLSF